jgi:hypothetical protein
MNLKNAKISWAPLPEPTAGYELRKLLRRSTCIVPMKPTPALLTHLQQLRGRYTLTFVIWPDHIAIEYVVHGNYIQDIAKKLKVPANTIKEWKATEIPEECGATVDTGGPCEVCAEAIGRYPDKDYPQAILMKKRKR